MENEIMNYDEAIETEVENDVVETEDSGMSTGVAMLLGAGLTAASVAAVKLGKKVIARFRARKEDQEAVEEDFEDVTDE
jgi:hypothetical protein